MTDFDLRHQFLVKRHEQWWAQVFTGSYIVLPKAAVYLWECYGTSGYCTSRDEIHIFFENQSWDLDELTEDARADAPMSKPRRRWEVELLHEFVHEVQTKMLNGLATAEGQALHQGLPSHKHFPGHSHDESFFTAVVKVATSLSLEATYLAENI